MGVGGVERREKKEAKVGKCNKGLVMRNCTWLDGLVITRRKKIKPKQINFSVWEVTI